MPARRRPVHALIAIAATIVVSACAVGPPSVAEVRADTPTSAPPAAPRVVASPSAAVAGPGAPPRPAERAAGSAAPSARPSATTSATPEPARAAFRMNLYRKGDYVAQYTFEWCVGASLQMALNMTTDASHTTRASQERLWEMAQAGSDSPFGGANPRGWVAALNELGVGPYELVSIPTFRGALQVAVHAIRETKRPVGLVMWRGRHAWVMSGFESIGDPAIHDEVKVTGIRVLDPLYPHGSAKWGPSPKPNALVSPATLARQFVIRDQSRVNLGVPPGYLLVLPTS